VLLQDGRPLPRIQVAVQESNQSAVTDSDGNFTLRDFPPGKYTLKAKGAAIGREVSGSKEVVLPAATEPARVEMRLQW
jgi:hypothetical protein